MPPRRKACPLRSVCAREGKQLSCVRDCGDHACYGSCALEGATDARVRSGYSLGPPWREGCGWRERSLWQTRRSWRRGQCGRQRCAACPHLWQGPVRVCRRRAVEHPSANPHHRQGPFRVCRRRAVERRREPMGARSAARPQGALPEAALMDEVYVNCREDVGCARPPGAACRCQKAQTRATSRVDKARRCRIKACRGGGVERASPRRERQEPGKCRANRRRRLGGSRHALGLDGPAATCARRLRGGRTGFEENQGRAWSH